MQTASKWLILANAIFAIIAVNADASAQNIDVGKAEYQSACASCHGIDAKGNGPVTRELKTRPTDLTVLAKKNNGVFPVNSVYQIIDGRESIASHGTREMPIWGWRFVPAEHFNLKLHLFAADFARACSTQSYHGSYRLSKSHSGEVSHGP